MSELPCTLREPIDLRFLASGAMQHVFLRVDEPLDGWVYKTPAIIDALLPSRPSVGALAPSGRGKRIAYELLFGHRLPPRYRQLTERFLPLYLRRARIRSFRRMLRILRAVDEAAPDADLVLPWRALPRVRATLHVQGECHPYRGPVLMQRRAEVFFDHAEGLDRFEWREVVRVQHRLWGMGVALADAAAALGPQGWALLDGRLHLADTCSLTDDLALALRVLSPELLERYLGQQPRLHGDRFLRDYYRLIREGIDQARLAELWRTDLPRRWSGSATVEPRTRRSGDASAGTS